MKRRSFLRLSVIAFFASVSIPLPAKMLPDKKPELPPSKFLNDVLRPCTLTIVSGSQKKNANLAKFITDHSKTRDVILASDYKTINNAPVGSIVIIWSMSPLSSYNTNYNMRKAVIRRILMTSLSGIKHTKDLSIFIFHDNSRTLEDSVGVTGLFLNSYIFDAERDMYLRNKRGICGERIFANTKDEGVLYG